MIFSVIGQPLPLFVAAQEEIITIKNEKITANNNFFFIMPILFNCISIFAVQIYSSLSLV